VSLPISGKIYTRTATHGEPGELADLIAVRSAAVT
jgi:hypothetical protein